MVLVKQHGQWSSSDLLAALSKQHWRLVKSREAQQAARGAYIDALRVCLQALEAAL